MEACAVAVNIIWWWCRHAKMCQWANDSA